LEELINNLKAEIEALKEVNSGLQDKIKDMGKTPSAKPVSTTAKPNPKDTYAAWRETMRGYIS
jgi:FtsZ-binding cell division protein ZapB